MAVILWRHGKTAPQAKALIEDELCRLGHGRQVNWKACALTTRMPYSLVVNIEGEIGEQEIRVQCSGPAADAALDGLRTAFERLFPGGEVTT